MNMHIKVIMEGIAALLLVTVPAHSKERLAPLGTTQPGYRIALEKYRQAGLRSKANAPIISRQDYRRMIAALSARETLQASRSPQYYNFKSYKSRQQAAVVGASAPKIYIFIKCDLPAGTARTGLSSPSMNGEPQPGFQLRNMAADDASQPTTIVTSMNVAPEIHRSQVRKTGQENWMDRQSSMARQQTRDLEKEALLQSLPFAVPVPGKPGYVTSPPGHFQGYIDVRGFTTGSVVIDPYSGERIRVP